MRVFVAGCVRGRVLAHHLVGRGREGDGHVRERRLAAGHPRHGGNGPRAITDGQVEKLRTVLNPVKLTQVGPVARSGEVIHRTRPSCG